MKAVNLLPPEHRAPKRSTSRKPRKPLSRGAFGALGLLAAVVLGVVALTLAGNTVREKESQLAASKAEEEAAKVEIGRLQAYGTFRQLAADRIGTVRKIATSRFAWEQALRDLSRAMPGDVTLSSLTATVTAGARAGEASSSNPLRASSTAPAIELAGCTRDHDTVARLMARLRGVRGITRVALASSAKSDDLAAVSDGGGSEVASGCGKGDTPTFQIVMFFEEAPEAAAAASGAPATATPTPAGTADPAATPTPTGASDPAVTATPGDGAAGESTPAPTVEADAE